MERLKCMHLTMNQKAESPVTEGNDAEGAPVRGKRSEQSFWVRQSKPAEYCGFFVARKNDRFL